MAATPEQIAAAEAQARAVFAAAQEQIARDRAAQIAAAESAATAKAAAAAETRTR